MHRWSLGERTAGVSLFGLERVLKLSSELRSSQLWFYGFRVGSCLFLEQYLSSFFWFLSFVERLEPSSLLLTFDCGDDLPTVIVLPSSIPPLSLFEGQPLCFWHLDSLLLSPLDCVPDVADFWWHSSTVAECIVITPSNNLFFICDQCVRLIRYRHNCRLWWFEWKKIRLGLLRTFCLHLIHIHMIVVQIRSSWTLN